MIYGVRIVPEASLDPYFKVEFSYQDENVVINKTYVDIVRKPPKTQITYAPEICEVINQLDKSKLELEILNKVVEYLLRDSNDSLIRPKRIL